MSATGEVSLHLHTLHATQQRVLAEARRFNVVACGRRFGKTTLGAEALIGPALAGQPVAWFAPTYKMLTEVWRELADILAPVTRARRADEHRIDLYGGGHVDMWSLDNPDAARGRFYARVVIDEAAQVAGLADAWQMVIRPTLTDLTGDAWFLSTPRGLNFFHTLYQWGQDAHYPDWVSWSFPSTANPHLPAAEIAAAGAELPELVFAQEYLAQFLEAGAGVFRRVLEAATGALQDPAPGHAYVMGCDWGKVNDFTVLCVIDATTRRQVALDRFNRIDYAYQVERVEALHDRYRPTQILAESNSIGVPVIEQLQRKRLPVYAWTNTNATKAFVVEQLGVAFERAEVTILAEDASPAARAQRAELLAYAAERLPSGLIRYGAPAGMHDDTIIALALAWALAARPSKRARVRDFEVVAEDE